MIEIRFKIIKNYISKLIIIPNHFKYSNNKSNNKNKIYYNNVLYYK